ncbi:MAG TPA: glycosyltransferase family 2 protein [Mariniphaga anaerophila]|uniref:Glycosyltransferase family 2 protein n=1 Tax=Mariniphaga anaerophila TaxID=1484053 RepID=A0A831LQ98_9BACT|nr:glycosyltransferase family 2 protein [Mariniphaga anaerophila]
MRFIRKIGGLRVLPGKIIEVFREQGFNGAVNKLRYIVKQAFVGDMHTLNLQGYETWFKRYCAVTGEGRKRMLEITDAFQNPPFISVLLPTYNSHPLWLKAAIESLRNQIYPHWELCIADDASTNENTVALLKEYCEKDSRIKVQFRKKNGHISEASNSALEMAEGEFVALLDHDDLFTEDALFWVATAINKNSGAALIYSDEDKTDTKGRLLEPYFKCDWNYHLFLSQNMVSHLGVYKTSIARQIGGFRKGFEGSQDYDLALRFIELIDEKQIVHIPRVLYHWRIHKQSTAVNAQSKPYATKAARRAIAEHLKRINVQAEVEILPINLYRVKYNLPEVLPMVSIIISTRNNPELLQKCMESILKKTSYKNVEIIVVDNNSDEPETVKYLSELQNKREVKILADKREFNFSAINNQAAQNAKGEFLLFINDDTEVIHKEWLSEMVCIVAQDRVGVVGAKLWYPNNTLQHGGIILGIKGVAGHAHKYFDKLNQGYLGRANLIQEFSAVTGACMLVKKELFNRVGGFDENLAIAYNDIDLCLRIRKQGLKVVWTPYAELIHHESQSRGDDFQDEKYERLKKESAYLLNRWGDIIQNDPAYSPNLTLEAENFGLAWPPRLFNDFRNAVPNE